mmetsp:Transcript_30883/g.72797  ORF Transcript_30883/g.72797 Transcript_30883/m.72797 type:complete len:228 (+) Transcript_30883:687-1370(+)
MCFLEHDFHVGDFVVQRSNHVVLVRLLLSGCILRLHLRQLSFVPEQRFVCGFRSMQFSLGLSQLASDCVELVGQSSYRIVRRLGWRGSYRLRGNLFAEEIAHSLQVFAGCATGTGNKGHFIVVVNIVQESQDVLRISQFFERVDVCERAYKAATRNILFLICGTNEGSFVTPTDFAVENMSVAYSSSLYFTTSSGHSKQVVALWGLGWIRTQKETFLFQLINRQCCL